MARVRCAALAESWKTNGRLQKVDLQGAGVGRVGAHAIAEALKVNRSLQQLVLEVDHANREGAASIANALRSNTTITELVIGEASLFDEAVIAAINGAAPPPAPACAPARGRRERVRRHPTTMYGSRSRGPEQGAC